MNAITLKIPEDLDVALNAASQRRGLSKSAIIREALERSLRMPAGAGTPAETWLLQWRGRLGKPRRRKSASGRSEDARLADMLAKHVR
jgi:predicted transcriptional regulator